MGLSHHRFDPEDVSWDVPRSGTSDEDTSMVLLEMDSMSRRSKRIEALRGQHPTLSADDLRRLERTTFHKGTGSGKPRKHRPSRSPKKRLVGAH